MYESPNKEYSRVNDLWTFDSKNPLHSVVGDVFIYVCDICKQYTYTLFSHWQHKVKK